MAGDGKKEFIKKIMFTTKEGIFLLLVHVSYALLTLGSVLKKYPWDWPQIFWKSSTVFYTIIFYGVIPTSW